MKLKLLPIGLGFGLLSLAFAFNNCAQSISTGAKIQLDPFSSNAPVSSFEGTSYSQDSLVNDSVSHQANKSLLDNFNTLKMYVSSTPNGTFVENGSVCKGQEAYFKTVGVNPNLKFKGCASPVASQGCFAMSGHRNFEPHEWVAGNIVTKLTAAETTSYPAGDYAFYISGSNANTTIIHKVGVATLKTCTASGGAAPTAPVAPKTCGWTTVSNGGAAVFGCAQPTFSCIEANHNRISDIVCVGSGNSTVIGKWKCECK